MSNNGDFSLDDSEELIANLNSGKPSEFEQLRSALNLVAHVSELPPTSIPPVLPSGITQPIPVIPVKPANPRRTIVTSVIVMGMFASASLAAAAVTGIGPAVIVNAGHQAARLVKGVVGGVAQVVTGNPSDVAQNQATGPSTSLPNPALTPAPTNAEEDNQSDSEHLTTVIPALTNIFPPAPTESSSHENESQKPDTSDDNSNNSSVIQTPSVEDSATPTPKGEKEHSAEDNKKRPSAQPSSKPSEDNSDENAPAPTATPEVQPSPDGTSDQPTPTPSPSDQSSEDE